MAAVTAELEAKKKRRSARPETEERAAGAPRPSNGAAAGMPLFLYPPSTARSARSNGHGEIESAQPQAGESREEIARRAVPAAPARSNGHEALPPAPGAAAAQPEAAQPPAAPETAGHLLRPPPVQPRLRPPAPAAVEAEPRPSPDQPRAEAAATSCGRAARCSRDRPASGARRRRDRTRARSLRTSARARSRTPAPGGPLHRAAAAARRRAQPDRCASGSCGTGHTRRRSIRAA